MDTKELETFLTLARTPNYKKASEILNYSPSTLEHHIQVIENELGTRLFAREGRSLILTDEGRRFISYAEGMLNLYRRALFSFSEEEQPRVAIGGSEATVSYGLTGLLTGFTHRHPEVRIQVSAGSNAGTPEMILRGEADLGFYYSFDREKREGLSDTLLFSEPSCLICSRDNPLARRDKLRYSDLNGAAFVFPHDDCLCAVDLLSRLRMQGAGPGSAAYPGSMSLVIDRILREGALTALPYTTAERMTEHDGMVILGMEEEPTWLNARVLYKEKKLLSPAAWNLLCDTFDYVKNRIRKEDDPARNV